MFSMGEVPLYTHRWALTTYLSRRVDSAAWVKGAPTWNVLPLSLHPPPHTLHSTPYALEPTPYNLHPAPHIHTLHLHAPKRSHPYQCSC